MKLNFISHIEKIVGKTIEKPFETTGKFELLELDRLIKKELIDKKKHILNHIILPNHIDIYISETDLEKNKSNVPAIIEQIKESVYKFAKERGYDIHNQKFELTIKHSNILLPGQFNIHTQFIGSEPIKEFTPAAGTNTELQTTPVNTVKLPYIKIFLKAISAILIIYITLYIIKLITTGDNIFLMLNKAYSILLGLYGLLMLLFLLIPRYYNKYEEKYLYFTLGLFFIGNIFTFISFLIKPMPLHITIGVISYNLSNFIPDMFYSIVYSVIISSVFFILYTFLRSKYPKMDGLLLVNIFFLSGIGLTALFSTAPYIALYQKEPGLSLLPFKQFIWVIIGVTVFLLGIVFIKDKHYIILRRKKYIYLFLSLILIAFTGLFGREIHGKRLWLIYGPFSFQTIEAVKLLLLLFIAGYLNDDSNYLHPAVGNNKYKFDSSFWRYSGPFFLSWAIALFPIVLQKDIGSTFLLFLIFVLMFYIGSGNIFLSLSAFILTILLGIFSYYLGYPAIVHARIDMWLHPFGVSETIASSLWTIASGGWLGKGIGNGISYKIPMVQSDYNFSSIAEKLGFVGSMVVLFSYAVISYKGMKIALKTEDTYKKLIAVGITILLTLHVVIIIAGDLNIIPLTGITLPLISYGGSSIIISFLMLGILFNISLSESGKSNYERH